MTRGSGSGFGPVSTIDTAPVSIGNSIQGSQAIVEGVKDGVRIKGRDYMFQAAAVAASQTNWVLVGGCPIIPHAFVASVLRSYAGIYAEFVVHGVSFHFITSSATSATGDMMFYISKNRASALLDTSNPSFMSVVLSDPNTTIGPLWKNNSAYYKPVFKTYSTDILNDEDLMHEGPGELFLYTRSAALNPPGYVLVDFDITFKTLQVNIRELTFPMNRLKYNQYGLGYTSNVAIVQGNELVMQTGGPHLDGVTTSGITSDPALKLGDVFKIVFNVVSAGFSGGASASNLFEVGLRSGTEATIGVVPVTIDDGFTCFGVYINAGSSGVLMLYPTVTSAMAQQYPYLWGTTQAATNWNIPSWISLIGNVGGRLYQANF